MIAFGLFSAFPFRSRYARSADLFSGGVAVRGPAWFWGEFLAMPVRSVNWVKWEIGEIKGSWLRYTGVSRVVVLNIAAILIRDVFLALFRCFSKYL